MKSLRTTFCVVLLLLCLIAQGNGDTLQTHVLQGVEVYTHQTSRSTAPLQAINHHEFLHLGVTDIADALNRLSGITLRDYGGAGGMKTVSVRGFGAKHTGVTYDDVMLSDCQSGEIDVARYSLDNIHALRLVIGDNDDIFVSARQASSAAVLSIETMRTLPTDNHPHLTTQLKVGSFGYVNPLVRYAQRFNTHLGLCISADYLHADNDYPFTLHNGSTTTHEHRTNSKMNSGHVETDVYAFLNNNTLTGKFYYYDNDRQLPGIVRYYTNVCGERLHDRNVFGQARWLGHSSDEQWIWKVIAKMNWASSCYQDTLKANRKDDASYWQREYYASATILWHPSEHFSFDYAADYVFNNLNSSLASDNHPYRHSILQSLTGKYTLHSFNILARVLYSLYYNGAQRGEVSRDVHRLSPSLSLSYRLLSTEDLYLRASYKDIFRVPTFNENYFFHYGSTDLRPEKTDQYNIGMTWNKPWSNAFTTFFTIDTYLNHVKDKIVAVPYNMFIWKTINVAKVMAQGCDVNAKATYNLNTQQTLELSGTWSYQQVVNHTNKTSQHYGKQIAYTPLNAGSIALGWKNPWINLSLHGTGSSGRWADNNHYAGTKIDGYWEMGLTAYRQWKMHRKNKNNVPASSPRTLTLRLDIKNLFNKQYEIVAHYPMPKLAWQCSVTYQL